MKALLCYNEKDFRLEEIEKPSISDDEMLIELLYCGLCGSDIVRIFDTKGKPSVYGHEVVGRVSEIGSRVKNFKKGDIVVAAHHIPCGKCHYCKHGNHTMCEMYKSTNIYPGGFCQYIRLSSEHIKNTTFKLPEGSNPLEALFVEPLACCIRAMDRIPYMEGDVFSIVGAGAIGMLFLELTKLAGLKAVVIDVDNQRLEMAGELGADCIINPSEDDLSAEIKKMTPIGIDSAILTVTNKFTVTDALSYMRPGGQINIFGMGLDADPISVDFSRIYKSEFTIRSSYSTTPDIIARSYNLIVRDRKVDVSRLLSEALPLSEFKKGLDLMLARKIYKAFYKL